MITETMRLNRVTKSMVRYSSIEDEPKLGEFYMHQKAFPKDQPYPQVLVVTVQAKP